LEAGAVDYVRKPMDFVELEARMNTAFRIAESAAQNRLLLQREIDMRNRKLSTASMMVVEKNNLLFEFHDAFEQLEGEIENLSISEIKKQVKAFRKQTAYHLETDSSWEDFSTHFEEVHPNFFSKLRAECPDISHKDLKLSAYLRLGMDNKEIARLLNVSSGSIRIAVHRLKKKIGLGADVNFRDYIAGIE
jgi:DNA-binding NarL/FixJ family response regulator